MLQDVGKTKSINRLKKSSRELHRIKVHWSLLNIDTYILLPILCVLPCRLPEIAIVCPRTSTTLCMSCCTVSWCFLVWLSPEAECQTKHVFDLSQSRQTFIFISVKREMIGYEDREQRWHLCYAQSSRKGSIQAFDSLHRLLARPVKRTC